MIRSSLVLMMVAVVTSSAFGVGTVFGQTRQTDPTPLGAGHVAPSVVLENRPASFGDPADESHLESQFRFDAFDADAQEEAAFEMATASDHPLAPMTLTPSEQASAAFLLDPRVEEFLSIWEKLDIQGQIRFRHESDFERIGRPTRNRQRLRFRLGAEYQLNPEVLIGARLTTGDRKSSLEPIDRGGAPLSYQDAGDAFDKFEFNLDRIFFTITPAWAPDAWASLGKFALPLELNPIFAGPVGDLVWDEAAHPEGAAVGYTWRDVGGLDVIKFAGGVSAVLELASLDDSSLWFGQIWGERRLGGQWNLAGGVSYFHWNSLNPDGDTQLSFENNSGNAVFVVGPDPEDVVFASEFHIINPTIALTFGDQENRDCPCPLQLVYETFVNTGAFDADRDFGYSTGVAYGPAVFHREQRDWLVYYTWNEVEQDSVFTPVAQDDFLRATNFRGHMFGAVYFPWDQVEVRISALSDTPLDPIGGSEKTEWRGRIDLTARW